MDPKEAKAAGYRVTGELVRKLATDKLMSGETDKDGWRSEVERAEKYEGIADKILVGADHDQD